MAAELAGVDDAGVDDAGVDEAGVDEAGVDDAGVDEAGVDEAGVLDAAGVLELSATDELLLDFLLSLPPQAVKDAARVIINGICLSMLKLLR